MESAAVSQSHTRTFQDDNLPVQVSLQVFPASANDRIGGTSRCQIKSSAELAALHRAYYSSYSGTACPLCNQDFPQRKSLLRHLTTVQRHYDGAPFTCPQCGRGFSRKDVLARHQVSQHQRREFLVECERCHQLLRPRSLKEHKTSQACQAAKRTGIIKGEPRQESAGPVIDWEAEFTSMSPQLHAALDCVLLSAWLFVKLAPWGTRRDVAEMWFAEKSLSPSVEVFKLQNRLFQAINTAAKAANGRRSIYLLDALIVLTISTTHTHGWNDAQRHRMAYLRFAAELIRSLRCDRETWRQQELADAYNDVLCRVVPAAERRKCQDVIRLSIDMIRTSGFDGISRLTDGFQGRLTPQMVTEYYGLVTYEVCLEANWEKLKDIIAVASTVDDSATTSSGD